MPESKIKEHAPHSMVVLRAELKVEDPDSIKSDMDYRLAMEGPYSQMRETIIDSLEGLGLLDMPTEMGLRTTFEEGVPNAVFHGNLGRTSELRNVDRSEKEKFAAVTKRLAEEEQTDPTLIEGVEMGFEAYPSLSERDLRIHCNRHLYDRIVRLQVHLEFPDEHFEQPEMKPMLASSEVTDVETDTVLRRHEVPFEVVRHVSDLVKDTRPVALWIGLRDQGAGLPDHVLKAFDAADGFDPTAESLKDASGNGFLLMKTFADQVHVDSSDQGTLLMVRHTLPSEQDAL